MPKRVCVIALLLPALACGASSSTTPSPTATMFSLAGQVIDSATSAPISGATVSIADGPNAGKATTTDSSGTYGLTGLQPSGFTVNASASLYVSQPKGVTLAANQTLSFQLTRQPSTPQPSPTPSPSCKYTLSVGSTIDGYPNGGSFAVTVTTTMGCTWTAVSSDSWIHVSGSGSGSGAGGFTFAADANSGSARTGTVTVAGTTVTFNQTAACAFGVSPDTMFFGFPIFISLGGMANGGIAVSTSAGCAWTATSDDWIYMFTFGNGGVGHSLSGSGPGVVDVTAGVGLACARTGTVKIRWDGGGADVGVTQRGSALPPCGP